MAIRPAEPADQLGIVRLAATCFGSFQPPETSAMWRSLAPADAMVIACDGDDVVGMSMFVDLRLTVPGGAVLPMAGVSWVCVAPTHRRRGVLTEMFGELHSRMRGYPIAGLEASEAAIYGRFGYGPATVGETLSVRRREARFRPEVPDPGGVRIVTPVECRSQLEDVGERWRLATPGGLFTPPQLWDEVLADRESSRGGGSPQFALLHDDGFVFYRVHRDDDRKTLGINKFCALTTDAYIAMWRVLLGMDLMSEVTLQTPPDALLPYLLTDPRLVRVTGREDGLWLRIVDVPTVLEARTYPADLSVVLDLSDDVLGGGGRFALEIRDGKARCAPSAAAPDAFTSLSVLGSLYLGAHRASAFAAANRLRANDSVIAQLDAAFASDVPAEIGFGF